MRNSIRKLKGNIAKRKAVKDEALSESFKLSVNRKKNDEAIDNAKEHVLAVQREAKKCLNSTLFTSYREKLDIAQAEIIETLKDLKLTTMSEYGAICFDLIGKYRYIEELLTEIEQDSGEK